MNTTLLVTLITGAVTALGWLINHILTIWREEQKRKAQALLEHTELQLKELYGPLAFLLYDGRQTFDDLLDTLGRNYVFPIENDEELEMWMFWVEESFMPRNKKIKDLLMNKTHLVEGGEFPDSYVKFLNHHNSWVLQHRRWKEKGVTYSWHSKINWPDEFEREVVDTFQDLKERQSELLGKVAGEK